MTTGKKIMSSFYIKMDILSVKRIHRRVNMTQKDERNPDLEACF